MPAQPYAIAESAKAVLVCPACRGPLAWGETVDCNLCGRRYPIVDGIPVLQRDRAL